MKSQVEMAPETAISGYQYSADIVESQQEKEITNINVNFIVTADCYIFCIMLSVYLRGLQFRRLVLPGIFLS